MTAIKNITLQNPDLSNAAHMIEVNAKWGFPVVRMNCAKGKSVVICGAGPSLRGPEALCAIHNVKKAGGDVWGCNHALKWLKNNSKYVTHGAAVDPTMGMLKHWAAGYRVKYLLATTVNPRLVSMLAKHGIRDISFFHNYVGTCGGRDVEFDLYENLYPQTIIVGEGLNVVNRVLRLADFMGYERMYVAGADCAVTLTGDFHVGGVKAEDLNEDKMFGYSSPELTEVVGFKFKTTADMAVSGIDLAKAKRKYGGRMELIGNTFPKAIVGQSDEFYDRIMSWDNGPID